MKTYILTASILMLAPLARTTYGQDSSTSSTSQTSDQERVIVTAGLDEDRNQIVPDLGATSYTVGPNQIASESQGANAPFNQVILRMPGVAQDSYGQLHVRGEHANLQYRINGILLPEGITGFGQELDTHFVDNVSLITGSLPAQYGYRTAGIIDVTTKEGLTPGGSAETYDGSFDTTRETVTYGGAAGNLNYFVTSSYLHDDLGIENPSGSSRPLHDYTNQEKAFGYFSYLLDKTSRLSLFLSASYSDFQIPNNPGQTPVYTLTGVPTFNSAELHENQNEQNDYAILAYQKSLGNLNYQVAAFTRQSKVRFLPDPVGDLIFNGNASLVDRTILSNGLQGDASYILNDQHTLRGGIVFIADQAKVSTSTAVFPADAFGNQISSDPETIVDNGRKLGFLYGLYIQDEWHPIEKLTINVGARYDRYAAYVHEAQLSPRLNAVYTIDDATTAHAGYSRYFTPPPLELVQGTTISKFVDTTNVSPTSGDSPVKSERSNYFDMGLTRKIAQGFQMGLDGYYKVAKNQLDEGQFGTALIFSPFNYAHGKIYGVELTGTYVKDAFSAYSNIAFGRAVGRSVASGQFEFTQQELDYIATHNVFLDHDQRVTISSGVAYTWMDTLFSADMLFGSGLREGFANTGRVPNYYPVNLGVQHTFKWNRFDINDVKARFDIVNVFNQVYELRAGSGIGVQAPQFGSTRGFYGGLSLDF